MQINHFTDIQAWQEARMLNSEIHRHTQNEPLAKNFGLRDQMQRSSVSIMANIAEGFGRGGKKEFIRFLRISHGSAYELSSHLYVALDLGYINQEDFDTAQSKITDTVKLIGGFIRYLRKKD
ncbi:MAG: four helix bundle protein [Planctomycetota bacterium]|nr:MAG: four helix bundle protein [Planctomycetota bacterium]